MVEIKGLKKSFKKNQVLKGVDLTVSKGETTVILGPSGSGKSTLLRCINLLETPTEGDIRIDNISYQPHSKKSILAMRRSTAMVFQGYNLFPNMTALQNVIEGLVTVQKVEKKAAVERGVALLEKVGLGDKINYYPAQLSGGQQQRVAIARSLAINPKVILFDEPTSALDPELVQEVLAVIKAVAKESITTIIVTHELDFARGVADKVVFMDNGLIVEDGSPHEFFMNPKKERTIQFLERFRQEAVFYI